MKVIVQLFGVYRRFQDVDSIELDCPGAATIADARAALGAHAEANWQGWDAGILRRTVFASPEQVLRDADPLPGDGRIAILPPVSGG